MHELFTNKLKSSGKVDDQAIPDILEKLKIKKIKKKTLIVRQGTLCANLFFINTGMIRTYVQYHEKEVTTWVALAGTIETSAQSFLKQIPSEVSLQAVTDCELLVMSRDHYYQLLKVNPAFNEFAFRLMEDFYLRIEDKFYSYLFLSAEERFIKMQRQFPDHFKHVPLKYLASILRIKPETLSRLRKKLKQHT
jgi:CRP-like cAMP-binding protein